MKKVFLTAAAVSLLSATTAFSADFKEYPIGDAIEMGGMEVAAVYLQPITMEPRGIDLPASQADIHLEADIHAVKGNKNGFGAGEWMPYLTVAYTLTNKDTGKQIGGNLMPMVAADGPHYGANIKMAGVGNYELTYFIEPPSKQGFGRHSDKATGVGKWFAPFTASYEFKFSGLKK